MLGTLTTEQIDALLERNNTGRIGYSYEGRIFIVPVNYAFNGNYLILHARPGHKISAMREHPQVCFEVDEIDDHDNWRSVVAWGEYEEVTEERERYYAMKFLVARLAQTKQSETFAIQDHSTDTPGESHLSKPVIYRIRLKEKSGRFEQH